MNDDEVGDDPDVSEDLFDEDEGGFADDGGYEYVDEGEDDLGDDLDRPHWGRDLAVVVGLVLVLVVVVWGVLAALPDPEASADDLKQFDEIDLGELEGADVQFGVTRSELLPVVVKEGGRGERSLAIVDAVDGTITDAGPIPVEGWATEVFPRASDRFVAMLVNVCEEKPVEADAGEECGGRPEVGQLPPVVLAVYDIERDSWQTLPFDDADARSAGLVDVDGSTAVFERSATSPDDPARWSTMDLTRTLALGEFGEEGAPRANGLVDRHGHLDGWGWKLRGANGWDPEATWTGSIDAKPATRTIPEGHRLDGAGPCVLIATSRPDHLDHLHRLCTS